MGIRERKERHKENLKRWILDAAIALLLQEGYEAVSIRRIASAIEFSPTTIYLYYKDKSDLLLALQKEGFKMLRSEFATIDKIDDPFERLKALCKSYLRFAFEHPEFYELMFLRKESLQGLKKISKEGGNGKKVIQLLLPILEDCQRANYFSGQDLHSFSVMVFSQGHGLISLYLLEDLSQVFHTKTVDIHGNNSFLDMVFRKFLLFLECMKG